MSLVEFGLDNYVKADVKENLYPLFLYSSLCESRITGSSIGQLLVSTNIHLKEKDAPPIRLTFPNRYYTPVVNENVVYPTFTLRTLDGKPFPIANQASVYLVVHIKKVV